MRARLQDLESTLWLWRTAWGSCQLSSSTENFPSCSWEPVALWPIPPCPGTGRGLLPKPSSGLLTCKVGLHSWWADLLGAAPVHAELLAARPGCVIMPSSLLACRACHPAPQSAAALLWDLWHPRRDTFREDLKHAPQASSVPLSWRNNILNISLLIKESKPKTEQTHHFPTKPTEVLYRILFSTVSLYAEEAVLKDISMVPFAHCCFLSQHYSSTAHLPWLFWPFST